MTEHAISLKDLKFSYEKSRIVLDVPEWHVERGDSVFLHGPSGSGKTTLLGILGGILKPDQGFVRISETELTQLSSGAKDQFRGSHIGFIFQMFNLIPYLNVLENITLPCMMSAQRRQRLGGTSPDVVAQNLAEQLGISALLSKPVVELSVGQQQRVAAARAFIGDPAVVIADEPTSALDTDHRQSFIKLLFNVCERSKSTLVFVSHDRSLAPLFNKNISLAALNRVAA